MFKEGLIILVIIVAVVTSILAALVLLVLIGTGISAALGYASVGNEMTGQVKKVLSQTPLFCYDRVDADVSLGVLRNGVGSVSMQDVWLTVPDPVDQKILQDAAANAKIVRIVYDVKRATFCWNDHIVKKVEVVE